MVLAAWRTVPGSGASESLKRPNRIEVEEVQTLIKEARYRDAITRTMNIFGLNLLGGFSALFVNAQEPYPDDAITLPDISVVRFTINAFVSVPWLARTIFHERVHIQQFLRGDWGRTDSLGDWVNEVEAYDRSVRVADVLGLSGAERQTNAALRSTYYRRLDASYRLRISGGSYKVKIEDRAPGAPTPSTE